MNSRDENQVQKKKWTAPKLTRSNLRDSTLGTGGTTKDGDKTLTSLGKAKKSK